MTDELSVSELRASAKLAGYEKIQREGSPTPVPLDTWNGFSTEAGSAFQHVDVYFALDGNLVTVFKAGKLASRYILS